MWLVHAAKEVNSQVISIDNKCDRVSYTLKVIKDLRLDNYVEVLYSDARNYKHYRENIVFMFIDGKKDEYHQYLNAAEKYFVPRALVPAHNTLSDAHKMKPYIEKV